MTEIESHIYNLELSHNWETGGTTLRFRDQDGNSLSKDQKVAATATLVHIGGLLNKVLDHGRALKSCGIEMPTDSETENQEILRLAGELLDGHLQDQDIQNAAGPETMGS